MQRLYFVVDGFDALDERSMDEYVDEDARGDIFEFLMGMKLRHTFVSSGSADCDMGGELANLCYRGFYEMKFCGGMNTVSCVIISQLYSDGFHTRIFKDEMSSWWLRYETELPLLDGALDAFHYYFAPS
jgi:hypothetical protein